MSKHVSHAVLRAPLTAVVEPLNFRLRHPAISYRSAVWIARIGRFVSVWLPIWVICTAHMMSRGRALEASLIFTLIWKLAFRRAYADAAANIWTVGAKIAAAVGALTGALGVLALVAVVPQFRVPWSALLEITGAVLVASSLWETIVANSLAARRRVLVVGTADGGAELLAELARSPELPFVVVAILDEGSEPDEIEGIPLYGGGADLAKIVEWERPQIVVLANNDFESQELEKLLDVGHLGFKVVGLPAFYEHAFGRLPVRNLTSGWFLSILNLYRRPYTRFAKRTFDIVVAVTALLLVAPFFPLIALLVRRTPGPVLFRQIRLGEGGKPFVVYKFRTMANDAEAGGAVWATEDDPRITPAGHYLRKLRADELPQFWNVLKGDMSIVGPRPERPEFMETLRAEVPFWSRRHLVKPGITGWAQVRYGYAADAAGTEQKLSYDLWYLANRSLVLDLAVCAKTFSILLTGSGAR